MVRPREEDTGLVHGIRFSTVGSPRPSAPGTTHEPTGLDLAMKLHYLKAVYIFSAEAARDITVMRVKEGMFALFEQIFWATGRFRRHESGRPYIKCNDCGSRFVEGRCDFTVKEWLREPDRSVDEFLVYHKPVGPELAFSPLIYVQMTRFRCGGLSLGLSWAHVLGDPFSLSYCFNQWAQAFAGEKVYIPRPSNRERGFLRPKTNPDPKRAGKEPVFIKRVDPVGDHWVTPNKKKMATFNFSLTVAQISPYFPANASAENNDDQTPVVFETLCGIIWKCIARVREQPEPVTITIIRKDPKGSKAGKVSNDQMMSSIKVDFKVAEAEVEELIRRIGEGRDVRSEMDEIGEREDGGLDYVVYGAKLTFVDMREVGFYGVRLMGKQPESVYCRVEGVGDEGAVVVLPAAAAAAAAAKGEGRGVTVTVTLPEEEIDRFRSELMKCGVLLPENGRK